MGAQGAPLHLDCSGGVKPAAYWLRGRPLGPASFYWPQMLRSITAAEELGTFWMENFALPVAPQRRETTCSDVLKPGAATVTLRRNQTSNL